MKYYNIARAFRICIAVFVVVCMGNALAGGHRPRQNSVAFSVDRFSVNPGQNISVNFKSADYFYGAPRYAYMPVIIIPIDIEASQLTRKIIDEKALILGVLASSPQGLPIGQAALPYKLAFDAPKRKGQYLILTARNSIFRLAPMSSSANFKQAFVPGAEDRAAFIAAILNGKNSLRPVSDFIVDPEAAAVKKLTPPLYLQVNRKTPIDEEILGGMVEKPIVFSWFVDPKFSGDKSRVVYRFKLEPQDDDFGEWTTATEIKYSFLQKGVLEFQVQARYIGPEGKYDSVPASFQFDLPKNYITKPTKDTLKGPYGMPIQSENLAFEQVYAKSRALLIGAWRFDDSQNFPQFEKLKIEKDLSELETALKRNGFAVNVVKGETVTREAMMDALQELVDSSGRDDRLFVYFSTHGFPDPGNPSDGYLATSDCKMRSPTVRCLRLNDLQTHVDRAIDGKNVRQVLFAVDSCFSGLGVVRKASGAVEMSRLARPKGAFMLTAGMADQTAQIDPILGMSTFTHYLVEGLNGAADIMGNSGLITLSELYVYVQYQVALATKEQQIPMLGRMKGDGEMIFKPLGK